MAYSMTDAELAHFNALPQGMKKYFNYYLESFYYLQPRKIRQANQLTLLNNLQRGDMNISSTLLLTLFNRVLSSSYDDKMQVKFVPGEEMDQKKVNSLNILAQNDYREMDKARLDYDWMWDTLFFGRGYMETLRFDTKRKLMMPHVINPLVFGYDPFFAETKNWRYYWKWITKSKVELQQLLKAGILKGINSIDDIPSGVDAFLWNYKVIRDRAKDVTPNADNSYMGDVYQILEMYAHDDEGNRCVFWFDRNFAKCLYMEKLDLQDGDDIVAPDGTLIGTNSNWPIIVKEAYREPHSSVPFSVADLLEDKHRARSVLLNLAFIAAKDKANPLYVYNKDLVDDITQLFSRQVSQHIPVKDVQNAIAPLNTDAAMDPSLQAFMQMLNSEASDPVGANIQAQERGSGRETATEAAIQQQLADLAQSIQSKVMQFGEVDFWAAWLARYKRYTKAGDEKIATIVGVKGMSFEKIDLGEIQTKFPPGILIFSAKEAEYKELVLRRDMMEMLPVLTPTLTPDGLRNFYKYAFMPKFLNDPQMIDIIYPDTSDEIKAEEENEQLVNESLPPVQPTDNHEQHIAIHYMAKNSWAKWVHIAWHEELLTQQKKEMMQQQQMQMAQAAQSGAKPSQPGAEPAPPQPGVAKMSPMAAASSLKKETVKNINDKQSKQGIN